jgi:hypothetical protein
VASFDEVDELVDDGAGLSHLDVVALEGQPVAAQPEGDAEAVAEGVKDAVVDRGQFGRDLIRDRQNFLQVVQV